MATTETYKTEQLSVLLLGTQMEIGGAQKVLLSKARWLHGRGHRVQVVFLYDKQGLEQSWRDQYAFPVWNLRAWRSNGFVLANLFRLLRGAVQLFRLARRDVDVTEAFTQHSNLIGLPLAWAAGVPVRLATVHGILPSRGNWLARLHGWLVNSRFTSHLVCVSDQMREYAMKEEQVRPEHISVIENGIEVIQTRAIPEEDLARLRWALRLPEQAHLLLAVGRLIPAKGHAVLLRAMATLTENQTNVICAIAGEGSLQTQLERQARELGIMQRMRFLGLRQDVPQLLKLAELYVQPSLSEGLSMAMLEAMAAGLPIVATDVGAAGKVIEHERSGLLVPANDPGALAGALQTLLDDETLRNRLGAAARQRVQTSYTLEDTCRAYEELMYAQFAKAAA